MRVTIATSFNTAFTALIVNAQLPPGVDTPTIFRRTGLLNGQYSDFTTAWYASVGSTIGITLFFNVLLGPARGPYWWGPRNTQKPFSTERRFATRKQLLTFLASLPPNAKGASPADAMQYATHFSRA